MGRKLTKYFGSYTLDQHKSKTGRGILEVIDVGDLNINYIIDLVMLGNVGISREEAGEKLDAYVAAHEDNSYVSAYFELLKEYDMDTKLLKSAGIKVQDLIDDYNNNLKEEKDIINKKIESSVNVETEQKIKTENIDNAL